MDNGTISFTVLIINADERALLGMWCASLLRNACLGDNWNDQNESGRRKEKDDDGADDDEIDENVEE